MNLCPTCNQPVADPTSAAVLPPSELEALSAWWHTGSTRRAADLLSRAQRTVINQLYSARIRNNVHTTVELVPLYLGSLRSVNELMTEHNSRRGEAA